MVDEAKKSSLRAALFNLTPSQVLPGLDASRNLGHVTLNPLSGYVLGFHMFRYVFTVLCSVLGLGSMTEHAHAQGCPSYFRFVDMGLSVPGSTPQRGGPVFRVEDQQDGSNLLQKDSGACRDNVDVFTDGHTHPIPVVTQFGFKPEKVAPHVTELLVMRVDDDAADLADVHASPHRIARAAAGQAVTKGADFLCVGGQSAEPRSISCEVVNPFDPAFPLVVYCDAQTCMMSLMAIDDSIVVGARWDTLANASEQTTGQYVSDTIAQIHTFVAGKLSR